MKSRKMSLVAGLILVTAVVLAGTSSLVPAVGARSSGPAESQGLEGTWRVQVTIRDCASGTPLRTFPAFLTFAQGGTLTETTTGFPPTLRTPGHGLWSHLTGHSYGAMSEAFLFDPAGVWAGKQRLTQAIELGNQPEELNSSAINEVFDTNGNLVANGCATAVGSRME
jgi:hypothetical protein